MSLDRRRVVFGLIALLVLGGCSDGEGADGGTVASDTRSPSTRSANTYSSEVDGVSVTWPGGWQLVEAPLESRPLSNNVQILVLTTFEGAEAGRCAPDPDGAMAKMKSNDVLFMLRASDGAGDPRPARPPDLLAAAAPVRPGGCYPDGIEAWRMQFQEHGRPYEALIAAKSPLSEKRRSEIQEVWANLRLRPIDDGRGNALIGRPYWHSLYTHCGIRATTFDGREWVADPPLTRTPDAGNPPRGWGNPDEHGTIELRDEDTAVFTSRDGQRTATFRPRTPEDPPPAGCL